MPTETVSPRSRQARRALVQDGKTELRARQQALLLQAVAEFLDTTTLERGLAAIANLLHYRFQCRRVSIGVLDDDRLHLLAVSQHASPDRRSAESDLLIAVMREALHRDRITFLSGTPPTGVKLPAHQLLCSAMNDPQLITIPLGHDNQEVGVVCVEVDSSDALSPFTLSFLQHLGVVLAPLICVRSSADRSALARARLSLRQQLDNMRNGVLAARLLIASAVILVAGLIAFVPTTLEVRAAAEISPLDRRVITAPYDGIISALHVGVGQDVRPGQLLLSLDTRELELDRDSRLAELQGIGTELRAAMSAHDRKEYAILSARRDQVQAQLERVRRQIDQALLSAHAEGQIVSGDLSQLVGSAVKKGAKLLELAAPGEHEVHLLVDESDVSRIALGQTGELKLASDTRDTLSFTVASVHPIAEADNGRSRFLIKAELDAADAQLLPGQSGTARIHAGETTLLHAWTHDFTEWLARKRWEWWG